MHSSEQHGSTVVPDYGLLQLAASSYQQRKRLLHNAALLTTDWQCGTVCQQHCETVACHYIHIQAATENVHICSIKNTIRRCCGVFARLAPLYKTLDSQTKAYRYLMFPSIPVHDACILKV